MALQTPLSWLKDFVEIGMNTDNLAECLTTAGLEVETIENIGENWGEYCVVGQISKVRKHPNADVLYLVDVEFGGDKPNRNACQKRKYKCAKNNFIKQSSKIVVPIKKPIT